MQTFNPIRARSPSRSAGAFAKRAPGWVALLTLAALLLGGGCKVDQAREVNYYRSILDRKVAPTTLPADDEPLTLSKALALANQSDESLGISGETYVQALIQKQQAAAAFLPTVTFAPSFAAAQTPGGGNTGNGSTGTGAGGTGGTGGNGTGANGTGANGTGSGGGGTGGAVNSTGNSSSSSTLSGYRIHGDVETRTLAPLTGSINLYRGGGDVASLRAAEAVIAQRRDLLLDLQQSVLLGVAQTYYAVLRSEESVNVVKHSLELENARLQDVSGQFNNGLATRLAVAQSRAQLDATRVSLVAAERDVANGRTTLALLVGLPRVVNPLRDEFTVPNQVDVEPAYEMAAVEFRDDLRAAGNALEAARHGVDVAFAQYYPSVSLNLEGYLYREFYTDASKWDSLLSVSLPIFSAGRIEADVRTAWSQLRQAALAQSQTRRNALRDVALNYQNLQAARSTLRELNDEVAASQEAYDQSRDAFRNGLAVNLDVISAQDQLLNAQLQFVNARFDLTIYYLGLIRSTGQLTNLIHNAAQ